MDKALGRVLPADLGATWERILDRAAERVTPDDLTRFIRPVRPLKLSATELRLEAPNKLTLLCVTENFLEVIRESVAAVCDPRSTSSHRRTRCQV